MREEIESGLKNAVERGDTLEDAINSFINAGYNPVEVKEAAKNVSAGITTSVVNSSQTEKESSSGMFSENKTQKAPIDNLDQIQSKFDSMPAKQIDSKKENPQISPKQDLTKIQPQKVGTKTWVIGGLISLIVLLVIFLILVVIFKDKLIAWLASG